MHSSILTTTPAVVKLHFLGSQKAKPANLTVPLQLEAQARNSAALFVSASPPTPGIPQHSFVTSTAVTSRTLRSHPPCQELVNARAASIGTPTFLNASSTAQLTAILCMSTSIRPAASARQVSNGLVTMAVFMTLPRWAARSTVPSFRIPTGLKLVRDAAAELHTHGILSR